MLTKCLVSISGLMRALMKSSSSSRGIKILFLFLVVDGVLSKMKYAKSSSLMDSLKTISISISGVFLAYFESTFLLVLPFFVESNGIPDRNK